MLGIRLGVDGRIIGEGGAVDNSSDSSSTTFLLLRGDLGASSLSSSAAVTDETRGALFRFLGGVSSFSGFARDSPRRVDAESGARDLEDLVLRLFVAFDEDSPNFREESVGG